LPLGTCRVATFDTAPQSGSSELTAPTAHDGGVVDSVELAAALATGNPADEACREELLNGASLQSASSPGPIALFRDRYSLLLAELREKGIRFTGEDALARLAASGYDEVRITGVHGQDDFVVFLAPDDDAVVATIGIDGAAPGRLYAR